VLQLSKNHHWYSVGQLDARLIMPPKQYPSSGQGGSRPPRRGGAPNRGNNPSRGSAADSSKSSQDRGKAKQEEYEEAFPPLSGRTSHNLPPPERNQKAEPDRRQTASVVPQDPARGAGHQFPKPSQQATFGPSSTRPAWSSDKGKGKMPGKVHPNASTSDSTPESPLRI